MGSNENSCWCKMLPANTLPFVFVSLLLAATKEGGVCVPPAALRILPHRGYRGFCAERAVSGGVLAWLLADQCSPNSLCFMV